MRAPAFWGHRSVISTALLPLAWSYAGVGAWRRSQTTSYRAAVPVICVGNLVAGGAGKTPLVLELAAELKRRGRNPHLLTRGYGGVLRGPAAVDPALHACREVGDEALLLAAAAPTWVARDRAAGARPAMAAGADILVMDDGFQNLSLHRDLSLLVVDGGVGFGNGRVIPAGPLREPIAAGLARADAMVVLGEDRTGVAAETRLPVAHATLVPVGPAGHWRGRRVVAFAGIGRPAKFFETLQGLGADLVRSIEFPDHHPYREREVRAVLASAASSDAIAVTTAKDWVRLPREFQAEIESLPVTLGWRDAADSGTIGRLLDELIGAA